FKTKKVRSSNGIVTNRYQIKMDVEINGHSFRTTFNLSNRSKMRFPTLLGRKLLGNRFIVDVTKNRNPKRINTTKSV
ncbi:MAG TPA: clan AA aspartic protease, partial [Bacteroidetes bacterium]|nr:clan AA aspartic protease [Bacteroidota bacterium]